MSDYAVNTELDREVNVDHELTQHAISHVTRADEYLREIENLENRLDYARRMHSIHDETGQTLHKLAHIALEQLQDHKNFLKRAEPVPAQDVPIRKYQ